MESSILTIKENAIKIVSLFNTAAILTDTVEVSFIIKPKTSIVVTIGIKDNVKENNSTTVFHMDHDEPHNLVVTEQGVNSIMGQRIGSILFYLQILLAIQSNCKKFYLSNFTDEPSRAASGLGIYSLFTPRVTTESKTLTKQLVDSEGEMILDINKNSIDNWIKKMAEMAENAEKEKKINKKSYDKWNPNPTETMETFLKNFSVKPIYRTTTVMRRAQRKTDASSVHPCSRPSSKKGGNKPPIKRRTINRKRRTINRKRRTINRKRRTINRKRRTINRKRRTINRKRRTIK